MKKCIAFSAIPGSRAAWIPCVRRAQAGYALCRRHSDVVSGVMLGVCASGLLEDALKKLEKKRTDKKPTRTYVKAESAVRPKIGKQKSFGYEDGRLHQARTKSFNPENLRR
jgi:hypothetical protein